MDEPVIDILKSGAYAAISKTVDPKELLESLKGKLGPAGDEQAADW